MTLTLSTSRTFAALVVLVGSLVSCGDSPAHEPLPKGSKMKAFDTGDVTALVRTSFQDDTAWEEAREAVMGSYPIEGVAPNIEVVDDAAYDGKDFATLTEPPEGYEARVLIAFDDTSAAAADRPLLVIDWLADLDETTDEYRPGRLRALPEQVDTVAVNLTLANMDFEDFARAARRDGIFRGF